MKFVYTACLICCIFLYSHSGNAQRSTFSLGVKGSFGFSVPDPNSNINIKGQSYSLRTNASYKIGMAVQYILGNVVGIETAILNTTTSFSKKDPATASLQQSLGWNENISLNSYQVPFQLMYLIRLRTHPNMRIKLTGGIAMDWIIPTITYLPEDPLFVPSFLCSTRIKSSTGRFGHVEYGLEYQYSLGGSYELTKHSYLGTGTLHSTYSALSFTLYYFFLNKERADPQ